jgi:tight adherence protein B
MPQINLFDGTTALLFLGSGLAVLVLILFGSVFYFALKPRMALNKRLSNFGLRPVGGGKTGDRQAGARQNRIQERLQELEDKGKKKRRRNQIRSDLLQAGLDVSIKNFLMISAIIGLVSTGVYLLMGLPKVGAIPAGFVGAFLLPKMGLRMMAKSRQKKFTKNFANSIDVLVRGIKSGLPVGECLAIIGREAPEPVGGEFFLLVEGQKMGIAMDTLLLRGLERMPTPEFKFFAIVLQIQQQTGGNLADTLEGLSNVLRERKRMKDKIKSMSSEAKSSAAIIGSLPFFVAVMVTMMSPNYLDPLLYTDMGNYMIGGGMVWMGVGIAVMAKMINFDF